MNKKEKGDEVEELSHSTSSVLRHSHYTKKKCNLSLTTEKYKKKPPCTPFLEIAFLEPQPTPFYLSLSLFLQFSYTDDQRRCVVVHNLLLLLVINQKIK
jgi:hypothetical protein